MLSRGGVSLESGCNLSPQALFGSVQRDIPLLLSSQKCLNRHADARFCAGTVGTDTVTIGGLAIQDQTIELAQTLSTQFAQGTGDGLLGLAFGSINTVTPGPAQTPVEVCYFGTIPTYSVRIKLQGVFREPEGVLASVSSLDISHRLTVSVKEGTDSEQNMISQSDIPKTSELFTAYLGSVKDVADPDKGESFYTFGYIDQTALGGQTPYYTPIDSSQGFWMFDSASAAVNGKTVAQTGNKAIADTGTTLALVADATCKAIYDAIPGAKYDSTQQGYIFPSSTTADQLPIVSFAVGGQQFPVQKEDLGFADAGNGMVYGGIQSRGSMTFDILGDTFLKSVYAVNYPLLPDTLGQEADLWQIFDQGNTRFGVVSRSEPTQNTTVPAQGS